MFKILPAMAFLLLVFFAILLPWPVLAKVLHNFEECKQFFYKAQAPTWPPDAQLKNICQYYENNYYFATLYHQGFRIPYWSAYTLNVANCNPERRSTWYMEPQLAFPSAPPEMATAAVAVERAVQAAVDDARNRGMPVREREVKSQKQQELKQSQALNLDYENTAYDRGHLNPNSFQCGPGRDATFTLTNAVPMDSCFNQIRWAKLEKMLKSQLSTQCIGNGGTAYLVTGAIPNPDKKIPDPYHDKETDRTREYSRVSVPDYIWTAVCCDNPHDQNLKFSFSFLAENSEKPTLLILPLSELEYNLLKEFKKYNTFPRGQSFLIFADDCNAYSQRGQEVLEKINSAMDQAFQEQVSNAYLWWYPQTQLPSPGTSGTQGNLDSMRVTDMKFSLGFRDRQEWHNHYAKLYSENNMACVLSSISGSPMFRQRRSTDSSLSKVCTIQEQKHRPGSPVSARGWRCVGQTCDYHGQSYKWCSTSYSNTWDYCCTEKCALNPKARTYQCPSGSKSEVDCSPQYSMVTITGKPCRPDHPCGLYEENYYWCYTDYKNNWEYCCSPQHHCDYHEYSYTWCYVNDETGFSEKCTT